jgi:opacity protein-like surface antigen
MQKVLIIAALFTALITNINSQSKFQLQLHGGYLMPTADMEGVFPDTLNSTGQLDFSTARTLLTKKGFTFGSTFKFAVDTIGSAKLIGGLSYSLLSGSKDYPIPFEPSRTYKSTVSIFTISAGAEYTFNPDKKVSPFAGFELAANFFGGNIKADGDTSYTLDRSQETRLGLLAGVGLNINLSKKISAVIGVKYSLANLIGKSTESTTSTTTGNSNTDIGETGTSVNFEIPLNDGALGRNQAKTFSYFQFYAGISFSFGQMLRK